jgi:hypothetical protein
MSKFQLKQLSLACGMALGAASFANTASAIDLFISGATAQNKNLEKALFDICQAGAVKIASNVGFTVSCTALATGLGTNVNGQPLLISKESSGGSGNGIGPVSAGTTTLARPATSTAGCTQVTTADAIFGLNVWNCGAVTGAVKAPDAGIADVEPRLLGTAAQVANLATAGTVAVQFAPAVSNELYKKLQALQGKTVGDFSEAQAPSLQPAELRGILQGTLADWAAIYPTITPNAVGSGVTTELKLCRRGTTSGTQKTFEVRMLGQGCNGATASNSGALNVLLGNNDDATSLNDGVQFSTGTSTGQGGYRGRTDAYTVVINNGASDVMACMNAADTQGELAVGLLSTEVLPSGNWHFVKMGDVFPNLANLVNGTWDNLWSQATFNRRLAPAGAGAAYVVAQTVLMNSIQSGIGNPANITSIPLLGVAGLPSNGFTWDGIQPLVRGERRTTGGDVNNCQDALFQ